MEHLVLYRKYRPQVFGEIIGQEHVVKTLKNALAQNKLAHAYLFAGPRGSGKTTIARLLAKSANCANLSGADGGGAADKSSIRRSIALPSETSREGRGEGGSASVEPCNKCSNCLDFNSARSMDLIEIDAASNRGIDEIKNLRENVRFGPSTGKYKVYLIDEAHMLTKEAFNAFLKTLEEPPAHAIFILATTEAHRLPPTIISRTQKFDFKRLTTNELVRRLQFICQKEKATAEPEALKFITHEADGSMRDAEGLLGQILATGENKITLAQTEEILGLFSHRKVKDFIDLAVARDKPACLHWLQQAVDSGHDINQFLKAVNHYLRKMIMVGLSPELARYVEADIADDDFKVMAEQSKKISPLELTCWLKVFAEAKQNLEHYPLPQMAVEIAIINLLSDKRQATSDMENGNKISNNPEIQVPSFKLQDSMSDDKDAFKLVQSKWGEVIAAVKPHNHSLFGFLQGMKLKEVTPTALVLATKYAFHKERLSEVKNRKIIEDAVEKVIGKKLSLNCVLEK